MLPKAAVVIFLLAIIAVTLKTGEAGKAKPNEAPIPPPEKPPTVNTTEIRWKLERSPYTIYAEELCGTTYDLRRTTYDLRLYWAEERYQVFISAATSKGYGPEKRLDVAIGSPPDWIYRPKNVTTSTESANVTEPSIKRLDRRKFEARSSKCIITEKILRAPDKLDVQLGPIKETIYSLIYLIWHLRDTPDPEFTYRFEITPGKASKDSEWMPILETNKCCNVSYEHRAQYRTATIRMMIKTETETTGYTLSDVFILPNHRPSLFTLTMLGYNEKYVQLELAKTCETKTERLHYNSTDLDSQQSEPLYFNPQKEQGSGFLELEEKGRNSTSVNVKLKEPFVSNPYRYRLSIFAHSLSSKAKEIEDTSRKRKFPLIVKHREYAAKIYFRLEYWLMKNASIKGNTPFFLLLRDAGLPNKVRSAAIKAVKSKHTAEYATFRVTWSPPTKPNGAIVGYKVRWKLERSPYTMYEEKLCNITEYELRLYWGEERYQVFISAATSKGYGPEKRLDVAIGSPPDWTYRSAAPDEDLIEQRKFVPQSRKELRYKYAVRRERVLIALGTVLVGIMFGYYLKRSLYPKPAENKPDRKHRKKQGDQENKE
ncbi:hypothetical protein Q1695_013954 [Nippostrongylus brasiliensis]|nr:hypothetical protein Q1695_013954 [Nippostrongylus brasiliensis]